MCKSWAQAPGSAFGFPHYFQESGPWGWGEGPMRGRHRGFGRGRGHDQGPAEDEGFGSFGVRRPLRFLAFKLELDEKQVAEVARILDELKTERAQAAVDDRRTLSDFADALAGEAFDAAKAAAGADRRVASATRLKDAVARALTQIHAVLNADQRARLAYMIRTGILAM
jgi:Spy/CpxP family protein refolding chaperone